MSATGTAALPLFFCRLPAGPAPALFSSPPAPRFGRGATLAANIGYHLATWIGKIAIGLRFAGVPAG